MAKGGQNCRYKCRVMMRVWPTRTNWRKLLAIGAAISALVCFPLKASASTIIYQSIAGFDSHSSGKCCLFKL
jgi:hypothetical protein